MDWSSRSPRSSYLTLCDLFLVGYIKSKVHETRSRDLPALEERIRNAFASVSPTMSDVGQACVKRRLDCHEKGGAHVEVYH